MQFVGILALGNSTSPIYSSEVSHCTTNCCYMSGIMAIEAMANTSMSCLKVPLNLTTPKPSSFWDLGF